MKTDKRDYAQISRCSDANVLDSWPRTVHLHEALGYRSPREFRKQTVEVRARPIRCDSAWKIDPGKGVIGVQF